MVTVGLPYFVLSTTSPLVQVWFSRSYPGRSPYRLYALSNFGSLAALLSYPFLFEPAFDLPRQSWLWSAAFVGYVLLVRGCARRGCGAVGARCRPRPSRTPTARRAAPRPTESAADDVSTGVRWLRRALWLLLPACASLDAAWPRRTTSARTLPSCRFLWIVPLALYLLSFIICFDHPRWYVRGVWTALAAVAILIAADPDTVFDNLAAGCTV